MHAYMHAYKHVCMHMCIHAYKHVCMQAATEERRERGPPPYPAPTQPSLVFVTLKLTNFGHPLCSALHCIAAAAHQTEKMCGITGYGRGTLTQNRIEKQSSRGKLPTQSSASLAEHLTSVNGS